MARRDIKELIDSNLDNIEKWTRDGLTIKQIAKNLGISDRTLYRYKLSADSQLSQTIKAGRQVIVEELENTMVKSAKGFTRTIKKHAKVKHTIYDNGKKVEEWDDIVEYEEEEFYKPDTVAGIFLLKNWAGYMNEPANTKLKAKEVKIKESNSWT